MLLCSIIPYHCPSNKGENEKIIKEIEKKNCIAIPVDYDAIEWYGGGIGCTTHPIYRAHE